VRGLGSPSLQAGLAIQVVTARGRPKGPEVWASPGPLPASIDERAVTRFEIIDHGGGGATAVVRTETSETRAFLDHHEIWRFLADTGLLDRRRLGECVELEALWALGSDLIVTCDPDFLRLRDHNLMQFLNLMTPEEALVLVGVLSRITHGAFVDGRGGWNTGAYYGALARALTPAGWPAYSALAELQRHGAGDRLVFEFAGSIFDRLASTGRALDRMVAIWQCETNEDTLRELLDEFDRVILNSWAVYDNIALLVGHAVGISLEVPSDWSLLNRKWQAQVEAMGGARGRAVVALVRAERDRLEASQEVRHQLVHRARLTPVRAVRHKPGRMVAEPRVWLTDEGGLAKLEAAIRTSGEAASDWGIEERIGPRVQDIGVLSGDPIGATYKVQFGAQALVDPVVFALRVSAHSAWLANEVFLALDPASDSRLADPTKHRNVVFSGSVWEGLFSPQAASAAILSSPLSGLVDWALRLS